MPFFELQKFVSKLYRSVLVRPFQRYNIYNRAKKYLGPEAKRFFPAPRAIGTPNGITSLPYPHMSAKGSKGLSQRNLRFYEKGLANDSPEKQVTSSKTQSDDGFVIGASYKLEVMKTVVKIDQNSQLEPNQIESGNSGSDENRQLQRQARPLPKSVNLQLDDPRVIWEAPKVPPGRMNLNNLQELMLNKLADDEYWTPKRAAERFNIKEEYAEQLMKHLKQIRIVVSPRMYKFMNYVSKGNEAFHATKDLIYHVDKGLRSDLDKRYDKMFLPGEELAPEVKELIDPPSDPNNLQIILQTSANLKRLVKRPEPLKILPLNKAVEEERSKLIDSMPPRRLRGLSNEPRKVKSKVQTNENNPMQQLNGGISDNSKTVDSSPSRTNTS